jgi:predicted outer membrane repeat protein
VLRDLRPSKLSAAAAAVLGTSALLLLPGTHASAVALTVPCTGVNTADVAALKNAIGIANIVGGATLVLGAGCTFTLTAVDNTGAHGPNGLPPITSTMTIDGNGDTITRDTASGTTPPFRYFETTTGGLTISDLTLTKGLSGFPGGAIYGAGPLTVTGSTLSDNGAGSDGGAIYDNGMLTVTNSSFLRNNSNGGNGGAINSASGVVAASSSLKISGSTFSANTATQTGGAIRADNATVIVNSTLTGNTGFAGGGVFGNSTDISILDSTIADNGATFTHAGGGIANQGLQASVTVTNTIVADNTDDNCGNNSLHPITDGGHNLENGTSCAFAANAINGEPVLGSLANNGGPTFTRAITSSSPAFSKGDPAVCAGPAPAGAAGADQRGIARKTATPCDIGAFEAAAVLVVTPTVPPAGAVPATPAWPSAGLLVAGGGVLLLGTLAIVSRRRDGSGV